MNCKNGLTQGLVGKMDKTFVLQIVIALLIVALLAIFHIPDKLTCVSASKGGIFMCSMCACVPFIQMSVKS